MGFVKLVDDYTSDADVRAAALKGAAVLSGLYHQVNNQTIERVSTKTRLIDWWKLDGRQPVLPFAFPVNSSFLGTIDPSTLESDTTCFYGGFLFGDFDEIDIAVVDYSSVENVLCDVLASSLLLLSKNEFQLAYAFMQTAYSLMSLCARRVVETSSAPADDIEVTPYEL